MRAQEFADYYRRWDCQVFFTRGFFPAFLAAGGSVAFFISLLTRITRRTWSERLFFPLRRPHFCTSADYVYVAFEQGDRGTLNVTHEDALFLFAIISVFT